MSRRDNFQATLNHQQPEDLILDLGGCPLSTLMGKSYYNLMDFFHLDVERSDEILKWGQVHKLDEKLLELLDIDTRAVGSVQIPLRSQFRVLNKNEYIDEWGIKRVFTGKYWDITHSPLEGATVDDLKNFDWPDPTSMDRELLAKEAARARHLYEETDYVICADLPVYGVFELGCWICGFEDYLVKMLTDPDFIHEFSRRVVAYQKKVSEIYYDALGPYIHYTASGDDFATQRSLFMAKDTFDEMVMPYFKERIQCVKQHTDAAYLHHSCGAVDPLIPSLIDCGVDILNPIHPVTEGMQPKALKAKYGRDIVFHGGFDTQAEIFGSKEQIEKSVTRLVSDMYGNGGYIFAAAHNIQEDVPAENIVTMFQTARKVGKKQR